MWDNEHKLHRLLIVVKDECQSWYWENIMLSHYIPHGSSKPAIRENQSAPSCRKQEACTCIRRFKLILSESTSCIESLIHRLEASQASNTQHTPHGEGWKYFKQQKQEKLGQGIIYLLKKVMFTCISAIPVSKLQLMQLIKSVLKTPKSWSVQAEKTQVTHQQQKGLQT